MSIVKLIFDCSGHDYRFVPKFPQVARTSATNDFSPCRVLAVTKCYLQSASRSSVAHWLGGFRSKKATTGKCLLESSPVKTRTTTIVAKRV